MNWQIFLTIWLLIQMIVGTVRAVRYARFQKKKENLVIAAVIGTILKFVGIFVCLYFGGFYSF